jgi:hypothetical protein
VRRANGQVSGQIWTPVDMFSFTRNEQVSAVAALIRADILRIFKAARNRVARAADSAPARHSRLTFGAGRPG